MMNLSSLKRLAMMMVALLFLFFNSNAAAQDTGADTPPDEKEARQLEPVTVVDETVPVRRDLDPDSLVNPYRIEASARFGTEVFTESRIRDLHPVDFYDLLDRAIGIDLSYQGRRHPFFINSRGGGSFTYIIDGAVLPPSTDRILYKFPVAAIEELQVVRGSTCLALGPSIPVGSSGSGSGINTGFIIIRTRQPRKTQAVLAASVAKAEGGHPAETNVSLYAGTRAGELSSTNGYLGGLVSRMDRPSQESWYDGRSSSSGMANAGLQSGIFMLNVMGFTDRGEFEMQRGVGEDGTVSDVKWQYDPLETKILSTDMALQWTPNQATLLNLFLVDYDQSEHNGTFSSSAETSREYKEDTRGLGLRHNARFYDTLLQLSGQVSQSTGRGPTLSTGYNKYDTTVTGWSAAIEQGLFDRRLVLDGGYRQDRKHIDMASSGKSQSQAHDEADNDVDMAPARIYTLGAHMQITEALFLDGRYYHGDQGTNGDFDMRSQTGELHPEKQERIEVGLGLDLASFFRPALTWFSIRGSNVKSASSATYVLDGATYYYYTESDELRKGVELLVDGNIGKNTYYRLSWTHMYDDQTTSDGVVTDDNGVNAPENLYSITLSHHLRAWAFNLFVKKVDSWTDASSPIGTIRTDGLGGYTLVDANIRREFYFRPILLTVTLFGNNLGDEHYSTRYVTGFYPDRGRTVGLEVSLAY